MSSVIHLPKAFAPELAYPRLSMVGASIPLDEVKRLEALCRLEVLDTPPEAAFDSLVLLAAQICRAPIALITFVDANRQWFKARTGLDVTETPRDHAFCAHAILAPQQVMLVEDAALDPRYFANPLVLGEPRIRFYAGAPVVTSDGHVLGTICTIDRRPRTLEPREITSLGSLSRLVSVLLQHRLLTSGKRRWRSSASSSSVSSRSPAMA